MHDDKGTQGLNRYSYVFNNPLKYTDKTGECPECDYDYDYDDRDNYDQDNIPYGYQSEDGVLHQDIFLAPDGTVYYNIEVGSWEEKSLNLESDEFDDRDDGYGYYDEGINYEDVYILENGGDNNDKDNRDYASPIEPKWYRILYGTIEVDVPKEYLNQIAVIPESADNNSNAIILQDNGIYEGDGVYFKNVKGQWYKVQDFDKITITLTADKTFIISLFKNGVTTFIRDNSGFVTGEHPRASNPF